MNAAVVTSFHRPPRYGPFPTPSPAAPGEQLVDVLAAAVHPRVRSTADGTHYESTGELPLVPGIDGVGRTAAGDLVYFILPDTRAGSLAEQTVVDMRRSAVLPDGVDPVELAAVMNPAMSSWIALRRRIAFAPGSRVLVLGATGSAGRMAVQIAKHLGASHVVAADRDAGRLAELPGLGADAVVSLAGGADAVSAALGEAAARVDVVLDYLWGAATAVALPAVLRARADRGQPLDWVQIGSTAGLELAVPSAWLRSARLQLVGSGQGSVPTRDIVAELPALAEHLTTESYVVDAAPVPLADVEEAWGRNGPARLVVVP